MSTFLDGLNPLNWTLLGRIRFALTVPFITLFLYFLVAFWIPDFFTWILEWEFSGFPELVLSPGDCGFVIFTIAATALWVWLAPFMLRCDFP